MITIPQGTLNNAETRTAVIAGSINVKRVRFRNDILDIEKTVTARSGMTMNNPIMNAKVGKLNVGTIIEMILPATKMTTHMIFVNSEKARHRRK
jgi:hypothetical protein